QIYAWVLLPTGATVLLSNVLFANGLQAVDLRNNTVGIVLAALGCAVLGPLYGAVGVAGAVVLARIVLYFLEYRSVVALGYEVRTSGVFLVFAVTAAFLIVSFRAVGAANVLPAMVLGVLSALVMYGLAEYFSTLRGDTKRLGTQ
ncbi:MAG: hypothetical protein D6815_11150, partial [Candidatus Dadabacteria bacterium]